jgi:hypothetical protein
MIGSETARQLLDWFAPQALFELLLVRAVVEQCSSLPVRDFLRVALSSVLVRMSFQKSETRRTRVARDLQPRELLEQWLRKVADLRRLLAREHQSLRWPPAEVHEGDARDLDFLTPFGADLVVTSLPYPNVYDYRAAQQLRLMALGLNRDRPASADFGAHRELKCRTVQAFQSTLQADVGLILGSLKRALKRSGLCAFVVGTPRIHGENEDIAWVLRKAADDAGFRVLGSFGLNSSSTTSSLRTERRLERAPEKIVLLQS